MKAFITDRHDGEGTFPVFPAGTVVENIEPNEEYDHWLSCSINGMNTYVPDVFVKDDRLTREYNPTELVVDKGELVEVEEIVYEWLYAEKADGTRGWIPAEKVVSLKQ